MSANFTPNMHSYSNMSPFRYWVQKVLPLVYDDSLSYAELLYKVVAFLNNVIDTANDLTSDMTALYTAYGELQDYVNEYFDNLDLSSEVDRKLDEMVLDGTIPQIINTYLGDHIGAYVTAWLNDHPEATTTVQDGSITNAKLVQSGGILSDVDGLKETLGYVHATNITYPADGVSYGTIENNILIEDTPLSGSMGGLPIINGQSLPESNAGFPIHSNHVFVFGCQINIQSGTSIRACDFGAELRHDEVSTLKFTSADVYHWTIDDDILTVFFRFDVLGAFPLPSEAHGTDSWHVTLEWYNVVDAPDGFNHLNFTIDNPYFVDYTGVPYVQQISDWYKSHWTEEFVDCTRVWQIEQSIINLSDTVSSLQIDAVPPLSSADIATIIGNVN